MPGLPEPSRTRIFSPRWARCPIRARPGAVGTAGTVLALSVAAVLAAARSSVALAEWAHDLPISARVRLGIGRRAPSESTIRRILQAVDLDALDAALSGWVAARLPTPLPSRPITRVIAVDGKTARGARHVDGRAAHLLAAFDHTSGVVLGQTEVDGKSNEITAFGL